MKPSSFSYFILIYFKVAAECIVTCNKGVKHDSYSTKKTILNKQKWNFPCMLIFIIYNVKY